MVGPVSAAGRRATRSVHVLIVMALIAACALLVVPGAADAHVRAKYKSEYKRQLTTFQKLFTAFSEKYDSARERSIGLAELMAPMIDDPARREQLVAQENYSLNIYSTCEALPDTWQRVVGRRVAAWVKKARRYFASSKDQRRFKRQAGLLKPDFTGLVSLAHDHVYLSFNALGMDPPALALAATEITMGDEDASTARTRFAKRMAALRKLL